jgi:predicted heme/steroid binding protein
MFPPPSSKIVQLAGPLDTPYTLEQLAQHDGSDASLPNWVAIKGVIFNVSTGTLYNPGTGYGKAFAGKDASRVSVVHPYSSCHH